MPEPKKLSQATPSKPSEITLEIILKIGDEAVKEVITQNKRKAPQPMSGSSSEKGKSALKGHAFPADFEGDIPEFSDEELKEEMRKADLEAKARRK